MGLGAGKVVVYYGFRHAIVNLLKCKMFALAYRSQLGAVTKRLMGTSS